MLLATSQVANHLEKRAFKMRVDDMASNICRSLAVGTMTFGWKFASEECDDDVSRQLMQSFLDAGHTEVDTAFAYSGGETEKIMGRGLHSSTSAQREPFLTQNAP
jgi:aryl-alcohol dehydrogenase-like predicted oxidoreductase